MKSPINFYIISIIGSLYIFYIYRLYFTGSKKTTGLFYKIDIAGPTTKSFDKVKSGDPNINEKVNVGEYTISITSYSDYVNGKKHSKGSESKIVKAGLNFVYVYLDRIGGVKRPIADPDANVDPPDTTYPFGSEITLNCETPGAVIYYTRNGGDPSSSGTQYTAPIPLDSLGTFTLKAIAVDPSSVLLNSEIFEAAYNVIPSGKVDEPATLSLVRGVVSGTVIGLSAAPGADIWYTTDGTDPAKGGVGSTKYTSGITITALTTIKAIAVKYGMYDSEMLEVEYIPFVRINPGTFMMGSSNGNGDANNPSPAEPDRSTNETRHSVTLSNGFYMSRYQVRQKQWYDVMGKTIEQQQASATTGTTDYGRGNNYPIYYVNWYEAIVFCNKLSMREGLSPVYSISGSTNPDVWIEANSGLIPTSNNATWNGVEMLSGTNGYRLPTEAEWEYACRAETTTPFSTGNNITTDQANYNGNYPYNGNPAGMYRGKTTEVGIFAFNAWGLSDMHGNVWEWCWDLYVADYFVIPSSGLDPQGAGSGSNRVLRGGSWLVNGQYLRSAYRDGIDPSGRYNNLGFRLVRP